jgi:hypothetical protein
MKNSAIRCGWFYELYFKNEVVSSKIRVSYVNVSHTPESTDSFVRSWP